MMGCFTSSTNYKLPDTVATPTNALSKAITPLVGKKYEAYNGEQTAGINGTQNDAMSMLRKMLGGGNNPSIRSIDNVPGTGKTGSTQDYMNPYTDAVLQPTIREINKSTARGLQGNDAQANMAGAFGDTGHALARSETERHGTEAIGDATSRAYHDAFSSAMAQKEHDIGQISSDKNLNANLIGQMFGQGTQEQQTKQIGDTSKFQEFLRKQGFDETQLAKIAAIVGSLQTGTAVTNPSTASSILSGLGSAFSFF